MYLERIAMDLHNTAIVREIIQRYLNAGLFNKRGGRLMEKGERYKALVDIKELSFGLNNAVYDMTVEFKSHGELLDRNYILRVYPDNDNVLKARKEAKRLTEIQHLRIPTPKLYFYEDKVEPLGYRFLILEKVPGELITDRISSFNEGQIKDFLGNLAYMLGNLHSLRSKRYDSYYLDDKTTRKMPFGDYIMQEADFTMRGFADLKLDKDYQVDPHYLLKWCQGHKPLLQLEGYSMVHGDLRPSNIIVKGHKISGFIDWEMSCYSDPASDLGWTLFFFKLYGDLKKERGYFFSEYWKYCEKYDFEARVNFYEVLAALKMIVYTRSVEKTNPEKFKKNADLFKRVKKIAPDYIEKITHRD
jgi:aminoglycoside phosphotransferase (APT) family kinase protein